MDWPLYRYDFVSHYVVVVLLRINRLESLPFLSSWKYVKSSGTQIIAHKNSINSQYFSLNSQFMAFSFSLCSPMKYTLSFLRASIDGQYSGKWCAYLPSWSVCCRHRSAETGNVINCHLTVEGTKFLILHVSWAIDVHSSLYIVNLPNSYRSMKLHRNLFAFAVTLHSQPVIRRSLQDVPFILLFSEETFNWQSNP